MKIQELWQKRELILALAERDIADRYAGQMLGICWSIFHPLFLITVYLLVFAYFFSLKTGQGSLGDDFTVYMLCGLIPWITCQDILNRSTTLILSNSSLVKQIAFPLEVLPIKVCLGGLPAQIVSSLLLFIFILYKHHGIEPFVLMWFPLFFLEILFLCGAGFFLAALGIIIRDLKDVIGLFCTVAIFGQPIFFKLSLLPTMVQKLMWCNPFTWQVLCFQDVFVNGSFQQPVAWLLFSSAAPVAFFGGLNFFSSTKHLFGDLL